MKINNSAVCLPLLFFLVFQANAENEAESEAGTDRVFPLIPIFPFLLPYTDVDLAENWNKLKTARNALYFLVRDTITVSNMNVKMNINKTNSNLHVW